MYRLRQPAEILQSSEIKPVAGHVSTSYDRLVLIWGGYYEDDNDPNRNVIYNHPQYVIVYDTEIKKWFRFLTTGPHPEENSGCCGILVDFIWYIFGGFFDDPEVSCEMYALNLRTLTWSIIQPSTNSYPTPRHKFVGWEHENKLYYFGGFGPPATALVSKHGSDRHYLDENVKFVQDNSNPYVSINCWNDQLISFDLTKKCWQEIVCKGDIPSARAAHAAVKLRDKRVVVFGGRHRELRLNDLYILDLTNFKWTKIMSDLSPLGRSWHTLTSLDDRYSILYGGFSQNRKPMSDFWYLDTYRMKWYKVEGKFEGQQRLWHSAVSIKGALYVFGGCKSDILEHFGRREFTNEMFVINCTPEPLLRLCLNLVLKRKSKEILRFLPPSVAKKANIETGFLFPKIRTPFELLSL